MKTFSSTGSLEHNGLQGMSGVSGLEAILSKAKEEEKQYEWLKAADHYEEALKVVADSDFLKKGDISESLAYSVYRAAFQAGNNNMFKERMVEAIARYKDARAVYSRSNEARRLPRISRCEAMVAFAGYWLAEEASERKKLIDECWTLAKDTMDAFIGEKENWELGRTYTQLSLSHFLKGSYFEGEYATRVQLLNEARQFGEQAITALQTSKDSWSLGKAYTQTAFVMDMLSVNLVDPVEQEKYGKKALYYALKARETSEEASLLESYWTVGMDIGSDESIALLDKELNYANKARDSFSLGWAMDMLSIYTFNKRETVEETEKRVELLEKALDYAKGARLEFSKLSWISPYIGIFWIESPYVRYYLSLASEEIDPDRRRDLLKKAIQSSSKDLRIAEESGYPAASKYVHDDLGRALLALAKTEREAEKKKALLQEALDNQNESIRLLERARYSGHFLGVNLNYLADIEYQIADLTIDCKNREKALLEVTRHKEKAVSLIIQDLHGYRSDDKSLHSRLGGYQFEYGEMLKSLYKLNGDRQLFEKAVDAVRQAAETFQKLGLTSRSAECWWRSGQVYDESFEYSKAAENFELASRDYRSASDKIPKLRKFYEEQALYMQAWIEVEKGRHHHERQEYGVAEEHFEQAANLHKNVQHWTYLSQNYTAWAEMEHAEELSRNGLEEEANKSFHLSLDLFDEAERSIQKHLSDIESSDERRMATSVLNATESRKLYCRARIAIEDAKSLDKKGEHASSANEYGAAAGIFNELTEDLKSETDRRECKFIACLCAAWQQMARAEAEESPHYYDEASRLFEKAKDLGQNEKTKALMLGHSRFCKALEAGRRFVDTQNVVEYTEAMKQLESATSYYVKSDFQNAYEYAKATRLLFDAYVHMSNGAKEIDPEKKTRDYMIAEKALKTSAVSYGKVGDNSRKERALRLLEKAQEQRELAISFVEVFHTPIVASTRAFSLPTPTSEQAVGLERLEHAEVTANLIVNRKELKVGEDVEMEIELANAGKGQALLNLIEGTFPEGFEIKAKPKAYRIEGFNINMKGKRLDPLKTEEIKFSIKPKHRGSFAVRPRILYLDENGNAKSAQPEPVTITVKELGIKGWIKGER